MAAPSDAIGPQPPTIEEHDSEAPQQEQQDTPTSPEQIEQGTGDEEFDYSDFELEDEDI